jgi:hypothetical protein
MNEILNDMGKSGLNPLVWILFVDGQDIKGVEMRLDREKRAVNENVNFIVIDMG